MKGFHQTVTLFLFIFLGVISCATYFALQRKSGNTGMDMGKAHLLRQKPQDVSTR